MEHQLGKYDFSIVEQEFPVTVFRRKISSVWKYVAIPGHVAIITFRGKRKCCLQSIETYACLTENYEKTMQEINEITNQFKQQQLNISTEDLEGIINSERYQILQIAKNI